jgi:hypothetical protein
MKTMCLLYLGLCSQLIMLKMFGLINIGLLGWIFLAPLLIYSVCWAGQFLRGFLGLYNDGHREDLYETGTK